MKLILLRHAKAARPSLRQDDRDRALAPRGLADAARMGDWLRAEGHVPDRILCSPALRTRQTCDALGLPRTPSDFPDALYLADAATLLACVATGGGTLLVIAHNPGIAEAAHAAVAEPPPHPDFARYPTCAVTVIETSAGLPGPVLAFRVPADLAG